MGLWICWYLRKKKDPVYTWAAYNSMGDGQFYKSTFAGTQNSGISTDGLFATRCKRGWYDRLDPVS